MNETNALQTPLLTIAIPTWNRAAYLAQNLAQLRSEMEEIAPGTVEIVVSDNCSPDHTGDVVQAELRQGAPIRYVRNPENLGWARNFAQAFELASGKYTLLLGDDDLLVDGALKLLLARLRESDYGVVSLRAYGFDEDFRKEYPGGKGRERTFTDSNRFLIAINRHFTLTSSCVINKSLISKVNARQYITTDLASFHLVLRASLAAGRNLYLDKYLLASKRQNSSNYDYTDIFVRQLWGIIDDHVAFGLTPRTVRILERIKLLSYYPFYMLDLRLSRKGDLAKTGQDLAARFGDRFLFRCWLLPIIRWPRPFAIVWGAGTTVIGRALDGQLWRGIVFAWNKFTKRLSRKSRPPSPS